jgi:effector-binding domain-containing protein
VRSGPAATIFPMVYQDLVQWITERGYHYVPGPGREVWVHGRDDPTEPGLQVFEVQMPFTRSAP